MQYILDTQTFIFPGYSLVRKVFPFSEAQKFYEKVEEKQAKQISKTHNFEDPYLHKVYSFARALESNEAETVNFLCPNVHKRCQRKLNLEKTPVFFHSISYCLSAQQCRD